MCCLFGFIDCNHTLTERQKTRLTAALATEAEARGTDATGIAYNSGGKLRIYKRPRPGHRMHFRIPDDASAIMGHTRMTTQGSEKKNYNNHPFSGRAGGKNFALAHNGMLYNDTILRKQLALPKTSIETDSYIAVQLLEQKKALNFASLKYTAEKLEGSFTVTVLDHRDRLYIVKGDNPMCLYYLPDMRLYVYASTEEILTQALARCGFIKGTPIRISTSCGEILRIDPNGEITRDKFDDWKLMTKHHNWRLWSDFDWGIPKSKAKPKVDPYVEELKSVAGYYGYDPETIDQLISEGFDPEEIEECLYCG